MELAPWLEKKAAQGWTLVGLEQTPDSVSTKVPERVSERGLNKRRPPAPAFFTRTSPALPSHPGSPATHVPQDFEWPEKTVLLLGREKEGIPADLLARLQATVEIPQLGLIRSLNVHVSGAIAAYEFTRQGLSTRA